MKARPILYDLSSLYSRLHERTPNGVGRVDLAFANHFLSSDDDRFGFMSTAIGPRVFPRSAALEALDIVRHHWGEAVSPESDEELAGVAAALREASPVRRFSKGRSGQFAHALAWVAKHGFLLGKSPGRFQARHSVYLNVSQFRVETDRRMRWLEQRPDIEPVFFVHDLLPLQLPEYFPAPEYARHSRLLAAVARRGRGVLVASQGVRAALARHLSALGRPDMPIFVAPLAPDPIFSARDAARFPVSDAPYFLMCGTIEPRKNHLLILHVWRDLVDRLGDGAPKLVLVGERGWEDEHIRDLLERSPRLSRSVVEVSGLPTPSLKRLMLGARALLMPSFGEGYGLPVVEALAVGLPVIASDISAFREIGDGRLTLIDPTDGPRWREAIRAFADESSGMRTQALARMDGYRPPSWPDTFKAVETFLVGLARKNGPRELSIGTRRGSIAETSSTMVATGPERAGCSAARASAEKGIVYDLTRLFVGPIFATPRGIDRVDLLLVNHFIRAHRRNFLGLLPTPWGVRVYDADRVESGLRRLEELWAERTEAVNDSAYAAVVQALAGHRTGGKIKGTTSLNALRQGQRMASLFSSTGIALGTSAILSVPANSVYLNVGHYALAMPFMLAWLNKRRDVKPILMLHDTIPLDRPELVSSHGVRHHQRMVRSAATFAAGLIVTTKHASEAILKAMASEGRADIRSLNIALPLAESFDSPVFLNPLLERVSYFVVCGTIEPRKNHLLLLDVWRRLVTSAGLTPHLLVVGSVGWRGREILGEMLRCEATRRHIHHVEGLSTQAMKSLIAQSRGLLSPTLAEGFGLPIVEALHLGATVIASDIPAHREVAADKARLLDPTDALKWRATIEAVAREPRPARRLGSSADARREREACFDLVDGFIAGF